MITQSLTRCIEKARRVAIITNAPRHIFHIQGVGYTQLPNISDSDKSSVYQFTVPVPKPIIKSR